MSDMTRSVTRFIHMSDMSFWSQAIPSGRGGGQRSTYMNEPRHANVTIDVTRSVTGFIHMSDKSFWSQGIPSGGEGRRSIDMHESCHAWGMWLVQWQDSFIWVTCWLLFLKRRRTLAIYLFVCMCVCKCVCVYVRTYACMYACMYVYGERKRERESIHRCTDMEADTCDVIICMYVCTYVCVCMYIVYTLPLSRSIARTRVRARACACARSLSIDMYTNGLWRYIC